MIPKVQQLAVLMKLCIEFAMHELPEQRTIHGPELLDEFRRYVNAEVDYNDIENWIAQTN